MKRHPSSLKIGMPGPHAMQAMPRQEHTPQDDAEAIDTWLVSGGATAFLTGPGFDPTFSGVQLLCSYFVPRGKTAWVKQIRVAPYCPAELTNPWQGWDATWQDFANLPLFGLGTIRATAQGGVYTTPMGWESYVDVGTEVLPQWKWWITCLPGNIDAQRAQLPAFSFADPNSWFLFPDIAIPITAASPYSVGVPGRSPGGRLQPQRMQVLQGDALNWHLLIPENTTACLWAQWQQSTTQVYARNATGQVIVGPAIPPLLPSFGSMLGYTQTTARPAAIEIGRHGWGG